jgi:hypothetical protein
MNPLILRQAAAQATIDRFQGKPLTLGKDDCVRMTVFCLKRLGVKFSLLKIGPYRTEIGAAKVLKDLGFANITEAGRCDDAQGGGVGRRGAGRRGRQRPGSGLLGSGGRLHGVSAR